MWQASRTTGEQALIVVRKTLRLGSCICYELRVAREIKLELGLCQFQVNASKLKTRVLIGGTTAVELGEVISYGTAHLHKTRGKGFVALAIGKDVVAAHGIQHMRIVLDTLVVSYIYISCKLHLYK